MCSLVIWLVKEISYCFQINFLETACNLEVPTICFVFLNRVEDFSDSSGNHTFVFFTLDISFHCVCFSTSCLTVWKDADLITVHCWSHKISDFLEYLCLGGALIKDPIKLELLSLSVTSFRNASLLSYRNIDNFNWLSILSFHDFLNSLLKDNIVRIVDSFQRGSNSAENSNIPFQFLKLIMKVFLKEVIGILLSFIKLIFMYLLLFDFFFHGCYWLSYLSSFILNIFKFWLMLHSFLPHNFKSTLLLSKNESCLLDFLLLLLLSLFKTWEFVFQLLFLFL